MMTLLLLAACNPDPSSWGYGDNNSINTDFNSDPPASDTDTGDTGTGDTGADTGTDTGKDSGEDSGSGTPPKDGTGYGVGDTAYNLQGASHTGIPWSLYDRFGSPVVLLVGHMDLGTVMTDPMGLLSTAGDGATTVALVGRSEISAPATIDDASRYASKYGLSAVLYDPSYADVDLWSESAAPKAYVIDSELVIQWVGFGGSITASAISGALEDL
ncbi:MAG: hypothetical protein ACI8RZ_004000 [Myxococcota bacterium]|jgi:hypothetical protein